jgi:hypothetical protein
MKFLPLLLISTISLASHEPTWTFERNGLVAYLQEPGVQEPPLRLACARPGYLEIDIASEAKHEVTLTNSGKISLTLRGEQTAPGRITSKVYFKSIAAEFLRDEGEIEVIGGKTYRMQLRGARDVLRALESSCTAVS